MSEKIYFVYTDDEGQYYYYDNDTQETSYDRPTSGQLLDPATSDPFVFPGEEPATPVPSLSPRTPLPDDNPVSDAIRVSIAEPFEKSAEPAAPTEERHRHRHRRRNHPCHSSLGDSPLDAQPRMRDRSGTRGGGVIIDVPHSVRHFHDRRKSFNVPPPRQSFFPDANALSLPGDLMNDIHKFQMTDFARQFFQEHRKGRVFSRKKISVEELTNFQEEPLKLPLLKARINNKTYVKKATDCFKHILAFTGADPSAKVRGAPSVSALVGMMSQSPELRDEVFFQLIKQTRNNPRHECLHKTWELFLIIATIFPSVRNSEVWIKSHLAANIKDSDKTVAEFAQFTYIRFSARCAAGRQLDIATPKQIMSIPEEMYSGHAMFGQSVYEQLWHQRRKYPKFPVPYLMHRLAEAIIEKGGETTEGVFRIPGNGRVVDAIIADLNADKDNLAAADLHNLASVFKKWFAQLPEKLISRDRFGEVQTAVETATCVKFVNKLPKTHTLTICYLVGFLQRMARAEAVTLMTAANLARVFSTNVIDCEVHDYNLIEKYTGISENFLLALIQEWDTSDLYPPAADLFVMPEEENKEQ